MDAVILVIHLIIALAIIIIVLLQPSEVGGFLGSGGSMSNLMAQRRSGDVLTRLTTILAGIFFLTSLSLAIMAEHRTAETKSILDVPAGEESATEQPAAPDTTLAPPPSDAALETVPAPAPEKPSAPISK